MSKEKITIYIKPSCTTVRKALKILRDSGVEFNPVNYYETPFTKRKLTGLIKKLGISPRELLRKNEKIYKELSLSKKELKDSEIIDLMIEHPDLLQRPIAVKGDTVIMARPAEEIEELL